MHGIKQHKLEDPFGASLQSSPDTAREEVLETDQVTRDRYLFRRRPDNPLCLRQAVHQ